MGGFSSAKFVNIQIPDSLSDLQNLSIVCNLDSPIYLTGMDEIKSFGIIFMHLMFIMLCFHPVNSQLLKMEMISLV
jgi:hypothetical protein